MDEKDLHASFHNLCQRIEIELATTMDEIARKTAISSGAYMESETNACLRIAPLSSPFIGIRNPTNSLTVEKQHVWAPADRLGRQGDIVVTQPGLAIASFPCGRFDCRPSKRIETCERSRV